MNKKEEKQINKHLIISIIALILAIIIFLGEYIF